MNDDDLEARLRRHFADRTAKEPIADGGGPVLPLASGRRHLGRALGAVAAAAVVLVGALVVLRDDDSARVHAVDDPTTTTTEPSTTSSTDPTTTTLGAPAPYTVVASSDGVLGWWDGTAWVQAEVTDAHPVADGDTFTVLGIGYPQTQDIAANVRSQAEFCVPGLLFDLDDFVVERPQTQHPPLAVRGVDDPSPRPAVELAVDTAAYADVAQSVVAELGIDDSAPELVQLVRADLEGDGVDEVLMVIEREDGDLFAELGDYSVAVLRQVVNDQPVTTILAQSIAVDDDFQTPFVQLSRISAVADANGDGRMEIALHQRYYEGSGTSLYELEDGGQPREVLRSGCGV